MRQILVVSQVALSLVLVVGALLFSGSLRKLLAVDAGFQENGVLLADIDFRRVQIPTDRRIAFKHQLLDTLGALPGIDGAGRSPDPTIERQQHQQQCLGGWRSIRAQAGSLLQ